MPLYLFFRVAARTNSLSKEDPGLGHKITGNIVRLVKVYSVLCSLGETLKRENYKLVDFRCFPDNSPTKNTGTNIH